MATPMKSGSKDIIERQPTEVPLVQYRSEQVSRRRHPSMKRILQQGAAIAGQSLTDFLVTTGAEKARQLVEQHRVITMSQAAYCEFTAALEQPARPITPHAAEVFGDFSGTVKEDGTFDWLFALSLWRELTATRSLVVRKTGWWRRETKRTLPT